MPDSLYGYIWSVNPRGQILLIVLTVLLELQRRIVNDAIKRADVDLLLLLFGGYLAYRFRVAGPAPESESVTADLLHATAVAVGRGKCFTA